MAAGFTAKIHHEKAVKKDGEGKDPKKSILKNLFPNKNLDKSIAAARDVVPPGLHVGSCRPHEVLFIMGWGL